VANSLHSSPVAPLHACMHARTLMLGCAAGAGHLDGQDEFARRSNAHLLAAAIVREARGLNAGLIVLKEFPAKYRPILEWFVHNDFTRIPSLPNVRLNIDYSSFDEYVGRTLSGDTRRKLRKKFRAAENGLPIKMSVVDDVTPIIDEVYPLYLQVYHRSKLHFERLTKAYFCGLGRWIGDKVRFFIWRQNGKIIAFGSCILYGDTIHAEYLGLDYAVALSLHLYHYTFRDLARPSASTACSIKVACDIGKLQCAVARRTVQVLCSSFDLVHDTFRLRLGVAEGAPDALLRLAADVPGCPSNPILVHDPSPVDSVSSTRPWGRWARPHRLCRQSNTGDRVAVASCQSLRRCGAQCRRGARSH